MPYYGYPIGTLILGWSIMTTHAETPPIITRVPADIHTRAQALGFVVEIYTYSYAGHGITGEIAYAISMPVPAWDDITRARYGRGRDQSALHTQMRKDLDELEAQMSGIEVVWDLDI